MPLSWREWLRELLCAIYQAWGGDCADLGPVENAIPKLVATFDAEGVPTFASGEERDEFLAQLDAVDAHSALSANDLTSQENSLLTKLISDLKNAA